jgi:hypothetical protein
MYIYICMYVCLPLHNLRSKTVGTEIVRRKATADCMMWGCKSFVDEDLNLQEYDVVSIGNLLTTLSVIHSRLHVN